MGKRIASIFLAFAVGLAVASIGAVLWLRAALDRPMPLPPEGALVRIPPGTSVRRMAALLEEDGVIGSRWWLLALARWESVERELRAGEYVFRGAPTVRDVVARLRAPEATERRVTIPEGRSASEVFQLLEEAGLGGADVFACVAEAPAWLLRHDLPATGVEGYLFPDTYGFAGDAEPDAILAAMVARHREKAGALAPARAAAGLDGHAMVTLASLIERETGNGAERPLIAAVFLNRLRLGMPLQSDPTAVYERPERRGQRITRDDLRLPSDYNTYLHRGLPPGPIANPGLAALEAAARPAPVDYLYFVARGDGTHVFSRNLDDHNRAVAELRRR